MERPILKQEIVDKIKSDQILFGKVAYALGVSVLSLQRILLNNEARLTQFSVLKVLREHLNLKQDTDLLTEMEPAA